METESTTPRDPSDRISDLPLDKQLELLGIAPTLETFIEAVSEVVFKVPLNEAFINDERDAHLPNGEGYVKIGGDDGGGIIIEYSTLEDVNETTTIRYNPNEFDDLRWELEKDSPLTLPEVDYSYKPTDDAIAVLRDRIIKGVKEIELRRIEQEARGDLPPIVTHTVPIQMGERAVEEAYKGTEDIELAPKYRSVL